jgi:hypothetical protein
MPRFLSENAFAWGGRFGALTRQNRVAIFLVCFHGLFSGSEQTVKFCRLTIVAKAMAARFFSRRH